MPVPGQIFKSMILIVIISEIARLGTIVSDCSCLSLNISSEKSGESSNSWGNLEWQKRILQHMQAQENIITGEHLNTYFHFFLVQNYWPPVYVQFIYVIIADDCEFSHMKQICTLFDFIYLIWLVNLNSCFYFKLFLSFNYSIIYLNKYLII